MFLMFPRNIFCVLATNFVLHYNVSELAKPRNIQDTVPVAHDKWSGASGPPLRSNPTDAL